MKKLLFSFLAAGLVLSGCKPNHVSISETFPTVDLKTADVESEFDEVDYYMENYSDHNREQKIGDDTWIGRLTPCEEDTCKNSVNYELIRVSQDGNEELIYSSEFVDYSSVEWDFSRNDTWFSFTYSWGGGHGGTATTISFLDGQEVFRSVNASFWGVTNYVELEAPGSSRYVVDVELSDICESTLAEYSNDPYSSKNGTNTLTALIATIDESITKRYPLDQPYEIPCAVIDSIVVDPIFKYAEVDFDKVILHFLGDGLEASLSIDESTKDLEVSYKLIN